MFQKSKFHIFVLVTVALVLNSDGLAVPNCSQAENLDLPTIRIYDASADEPNYEHNGTVILPRPKNENKHVFGWIGLECNHTKPVRWAFDLNFRKGMDDSYAQTARKIENFDDPTTYTFTAELELRALNSGLDFVMSCMSIDNLCERRVAQVSYDKQRKLYVLRALSKQEEKNNTLVTELEEAILRNENWGQKKNIVVDDGLPCSVNFSFVDNGDSYRYIFQPVPGNPEKSRFSPDRQLLENAYLYTDHLRKKCIIDDCKNSTFPCLESNKRDNRIQMYWPVIFYLDHGNISNVLHMYHTLETRGMKNGESQAGRMKFAWEASPKQNFMKMGNLPRKTYMGNTISVECHASPFWFSSGTKIGYLIVHQPNGSAGKHSNKNINILGQEELAEDAQLEPSGRVARGSITLPDNGSIDGYNVTVYCFSPVWDSPKEWTNLSRTIQVIGAKLQVELLVVEHSNKTEPQGLSQSNFTLSPEAKMEVFNEGNKTVTRLPLNSTFRTYCRVSGIPLPDEIVVTTPRNNTRINVTNYEVDGTREVFIEIINVDETHQGTYSCVATTLAGTAYREFEIRIGRWSADGQNENDSPWSSTLVIAIFSVLGAIAIIMLAIVVILVMRCQMEREELKRQTEEAIREFFEGVDSALLPTLDADGNPIDNCANDTVKCMPYDDSYEVHLSNWTFSGTLLGSGAYGQVRKGTVQLGNRKSVVAVKMAKCMEDIDDFRAALLELKIMAYVGHHPHIVKLIAASTNEIQSRNVLIGAELCANGSLHSYLQKRKRLFNNMVKDGKFHFASKEENAKLEDGVYMNLVVTSDISTLDLFKWCFQVASGMDYLASKKILHADLATRNILLTEDLVVKISDFGLSRELFENQEYTKRTHAPLPYKWMSIEALRYMKFSTKSDIWSYGVTLHEVFTLGDEPYPGQSWSEEFMNLLENGMRLDRPEYCTENVYDKIMMQCWQSEPAERIGFEDAKSFFEKAIGLLTSAKRNDDECREFC